MVQQVWDIAQPLVEHEGLELVDIDYRRERHGTVLRLFLDREGGAEEEASGVTLEELAPFSRRLGDVLDVHDVVPGAYTLEVSSPGINRRLRLPDHFRRYLGKRVRVRTAAPIEGRKSFLGELLTMDADSIVIAVDGSASPRIPFESIAQANYEPELPVAGGARRGKRGSSR